MEGMFYASPSPYTQTPATEETSFTLGILDSSMIAQSRYKPVSRYWYEKSSRSSNPLSSYPKEQNVTFFCPSVKI